MLATIAGIIGSVAAILGSAIWLVKKFGSSPEQDKEAVDADVESEQETVEKTGRPI